MPRLHSTALIAAFGATALSTPAFPQSAGSAHWLFHPVPATELRALSSDRPGNGENPFTLDPGHLQLEMSALGFTHVGARDPGAIGFGGAATKVRVGLRRGTEVQLLFDGYSFAKSAGAWDGATGGFGARAKVNLWGDYDGTTAFGLIPSLNLTRDGEGGWNRTAALSATFASKLPSAWMLGATAVAGTSAFGTDQSVTSGLAAVSLTHVARGPVSVMFEATAMRADLDVDATELRLGSGLLAALSSAFQVDVGVDLGVSRQADAVRAYLGIARRF